MNTGLFKKGSKMRRLVLIAFGLLVYQSIALAAPADHFVTTWKTDNPGTSNDQNLSMINNSGYSNKDQLKILTVDGGSDDTRI